MTRKHLMILAGCVGTSLAVVIMIYIAPAHSPGTSALEKPANPGVPAQITPAGPTRNDHPQPAAPEAQVDSLIEGAVSELKPIQWEEHVWDGNSEMSSEDLARAKRIVERFLDNFRKIERIKLHDSDVHTSLCPDAPPEIKQVNETHYVDMDITAQRRPLYFQAKGRFGTHQIDSTVTPVGKIQKDTALGFAESMVPMYLSSALAAFQEGYLAFDLQIRENVELPSDVADLASTVNWTVPPGARYDVLINSTPDGVYCNMFSRDTGLLECNLTFPPGTAWDGGKASVVNLYTYQKAGDVFYVRDMYGWGKYGSNSQRDFDIKVERHITNVEINGIAAQ